MANVDRPNGFRPMKTVSGAPVSGLIREYSVAARVDATNNHGDIYIGDPVKISTAGVVEVADANDTTIIGVCVSVGTTSGIDHGEAGYFDATNLEKSYLAHDEAGVIGVVPAQDVIFEIQTASDLDLSPGEVADITNTAATAHGSRLTGQSSCELTTATGAGEVVVIEDNTSPNNDTSLANARHLVKFIDAVIAQ